MSKQKDFFYSEEELKSEFWWGFLCGTFASTALLTVMTFGFRIL